MVANHARRHRDQGFTLVELIVAMVILATLAAIAIPSYNQYVLKAHRTEAKTALMDAASLEERYFSTSNLYTNNPMQLGYGVAGQRRVPVGSGWYNVISRHYRASACPADRLGSRRNARHLYDHCRPRPRQHASQ